MNSDLRPQYHFWNGDAWDVRRLVELSASLVVNEVSLSSISEVDTAYWYNGADLEPTVADIIGHVRLIGAADLSFPIILAHDGRVMDGMHRVARAILDGRSTIKAVRFDDLVEPDYRGYVLSDLPYD